MSGSATVRATLLALVLLAGCAVEGRVVEMPQSVVPLKRGDADLLTRVVWAESRSEPFEGQCAIVWVILNRLHREPGRFPSTVQGIIMQPYAFSCFNTSDPQCAKVKVVDEHDPAFIEAMYAVTSVLTGRVSSPVGSADHYFLTSMSKPPAWRKSMTLVKRLGSHTFMSEKP
jgi:N-acetylmuramoyl-L-alanine amidase